MLPQDFSNLYTKYCTTTIAKVLYFVRFIVALNYCITSPEGVTDFMRDIGNL